MLTGRLLPSAAALKGYSRAVAGSEFCQNRLPEPGVLRVMRERGLAVTLATSILTDAGLAAAAALAASAFRKGLIDEVIVNDWGLLKPLGRLRGLKLSAGRLLGVELSATEPAWTKRFLAEHRIVSAETDDAAMAARLRALGLKVSWHGPHAFRAVTTFCPHERHFSAGCGFSCEERLLRLESAHIKDHLLLAGKVYLAPASSARPPRWAARMVERPAVTGPRRLSPERAK